MGEPRTIEWVDKRVDYLFSLQEDRNAMYEEIDNARFGDWDLPEDISGVGWILKSVDPSFAITSNAAVDLVGSSNLTINITPADQEGLALADVHEQGLKWILDAASRRRKGTVLKEVSDSAVNYAEVATLVMYMPAQIKGMEEKGVSDKRIESMRRMGDFLIRTYHPYNVYPRYSEAGLEEVALITEENPWSVIDLWGDAAAELRGKIEGMTDAPSTVKVYEYMNLDQHVVRVALGEDKITLVDEPWNFPFMPWACNVGGGSLQEATDRDRDPMLGTMYHFDLFDIMNTTRTIMHSEMVRGAGNARKVYQSEDPDAGGPRIDDASGEMYEVIGAEERIAVSPLIQIDPNMTALYQQLRNDHQKATLSDLLLGGEVPSEAAFASINMITHSALQALEDAIDLAQTQIAQICEIIMLWIKYAAKEPIFGSYRAADNRNQIESFSIDPSEIDERGLYIDVYLDANLFVDQQQRIVAARAGIDAELISHQTAMEQTGITDARKEYELIAEEKMMRNELDIRLKNRVMEADQEVRAQIEAELMQRPEMQQLLQMAQVGAQVMEQQQAKEAEASAGPRRPPPSPGSTAPVPGQMPPEQGGNTLGVGLGAEGGEGGAIAGNAEPGVTSAPPQ